MWFRWETKLKLLSSYDLSDFDGIIRKMSVCIRLMMCSMKYLFFLRSFTKGIIWLTGIILVNTNMNMAQIWANHYENNMPRTRIIVKTVSVHLLLLVCIYLSIEMIQFTDQILQSLEDAILLLGHVLGSIEV